jgi:glycerol-3-phosphate dehydrogenase (NAD(P)+)
VEKNNNLSSPYAHVGVIGAGAWGTALALVAAQAGRRVTLWAREAEVVESIKIRRENRRFLPGVTLPETIVATSDLASASTADALLIAVPAQHLRTTLRSLPGAVMASVPLVLCAKGIERDTGMLLTEVLAECGAALPAILSGPSFARDVARNLPTAVAIAAGPPVAARLQATIGHAAFRPYVSEDLAGVALGGAAKNVYAIACGVVMGLGLGESARAALLARSFAELCRLGRVMGAKDESLMGLSGLGDLVLTATSAASRNYAFGFACGSGHPLSDQLSSGQPLAEGVETAPALADRAKRHGVELPIAEAVADILASRLAPEAAIPRLMARPFRSE